MDMYHRDTFLPPKLAYDAVLLIEKFSFRLSKHVEQYFSSHDKKHAFTKQGLVQAIENIRTFQKEPIEIGMQGKNIVKCTIRTEYDAWQDISIVFDCQNLLIRTAWLNLKDDVHGSLDKAKYKTA